ncbi:MAG TPA: trypsin-like peptidase domain-containing protein, partial [Blastocatellia bacterium]|nr:trypsin-like peptidase domain-containing protein [Blastocatellia bacterium]
MRIRVTRSVVLVFATAVVASAQQSQQQRPQQQTVSSQRNLSPWVVTVVHSVNTYKWLEQLRSQPNVQVGVRGTPPSNSLVVTTGLVVDGEGHVVTRLAALDPNDNEPDLTVATGDGNRLPARLIGVDCATGFAVIKVDRLGTKPPDWIGQNRVSNGFSVKILSMSLVRVTPPGEPQQREILVTPVITVNDGTVETGGVYSRLRGTYTLRAQWLLSRNDSSVVEAPDGSVVGIAQFAGVNRAYLYPAEYIRNGIVTRVLQKNGSVPSGW